MPPVGVQIGVAIANIPVLDETFATWYTRRRDIYKNTMPDLPHATRIIVLLRKFNRSDIYLCLSYFQPMDPADLIYEKMIISDLVSSKKTNSDVSFFILGLRSPCHTEICLRFLPLLDKKPDVRKSRRRSESAEGLLTASVQLERS
ncbi:unnamed protein product [Hymenolepis diminuta]|uniref:Annexin n=1 Tax=Hymenolepis diminuta TaxID=6216 RepID=A0A0R3SXF6_HYMDI|nr:unnamed protein product [Hymenolepis diminuta]